MGAGYWVTQETVSDAFGYASILSWLFAQVPQLWANYKLSSAEGLALPFLISWLAGDTTNLIGCLLTNQLAFQRNLAIYFCFCDFTLTIQYIYYTRFNPPATSLGPSYSSFNQGAETTEERWRRESGLTTSGTLPSPQTLRREYTRSYSTSRAPRARRTSRPGIESNAMQTSATSPTSRNATSDSSTSADDTMEHSVSSLPRGRALSRSTPILPPGPIVDEPTAMQRSVSVAGGRDGSRVKKQAAMIFLGAFALVGIGRAGLGTRQSLDVPTVRRAWDLSTPAPAQARPISLFDFVPASFTDKEPLPVLAKEAPPPSQDSSWQYIAGRISAWICACLYLTSRLPQIWKNYRRHSVEGLSMLLFCMAAMGNFFYVLSIVANPAVQHDEDFLVNSVPYLVGSGGTLCFDFTIFAQSWVYNPKRRRRYSHSIRSGKRRSHADDALDAEEAAALLTPESDDDAGLGKQPASRPRPRSRSTTGSTSRTRSRSRALSMSTEMAAPSQMVPGYGEPLGKLDEDAGSLLGSGFATPTPGEPYPSTQPRVSS